MKVINTILILACILAIPLALAAAADPSALQPFSSSDLPPAALPWQLAIIPVLTPLIIAGVKLLIPKIKTTIIPILAPALGLPRHTRHPRHLHHAKHHL